MIELYQEVGSIRRQELRRAGQEFGTRFNSSHEAYGVIREEFEEAMQALTEALDDFDVYWNGVKSDDDSARRGGLEHLRRDAQLAACEMIQVAAMAEKALRGYGSAVPRSKMVINLTRRGQFWKRRG